MWVVKIVYLDPDKDEKETKTVYIGQNAASVKDKSDAVVFTKGVAEPYEFGYIKAWLHNSRIDGGAIQSLEVVKL